MIEVKNAKSQQLKKKTGQICHLKLTWVIISVEFETELFAKYPKLFLNPSCAVAFLVTYLEEAVRYDRGCEQLSPLLGVNNVWLCLNLL